jgi:hypothetical protein
LDLVECVASPILAEVSADNIDTADNQIRRWLESRGIVAAPEAKREELESTISEKYHELRDSAYAVRSFRLL